MSLGARSAGHRTHRLTHVMPLRRPASFLSLPCLALRIDGGPGIFPSSRPVRSARGKVKRHERGPSLHIIAPRQWDTLRTIWGVPDSPYSSCPPPPKKKRSTISHPYYVLPCSTRANKKKEKKRTAAAPLLVTDCLRSYVPVI